MCVEVKELFIVGLFAFQSIDHRNDVIVLCTVGKDIRDELQVQKYQRRDSRLSSSTNVN